MKFIILGTLLTIGSAIVILPREQESAAKQPKAETLAALRTKTQVWGKWPCGVDKPYCAKYTNEEAELECKTAILREVMWMNCPSRCGICTIPPPPYEKDKMESSDSNCSDGRLPGWPCADQPYCKFYTDAEARLECKTPILNDIIVINCPTRCGLCRNLTALAENKKKVSLAPLAKDIALANSQDARLPGWPCADRAYCKFYSDDEAKLECKTPILKEIIMANCPTRCGLCKSKSAQSEQKRDFTEVWGKWPCGVDEPYCVMYTYAEAELECKTPILQDGMWQNCPSRCGLCTLRPPPAEKNVIERTLTNQMEKI